LKVVLAPGAGGSAETMQPWLAGLGRHGISAVAVDLPRRGAFPVRAEDAVEAFLAVAGVGPETVIGGHSYGGRVASHAATAAPFAGLLLLSYPLHPRGRPESALRTSHWPAIDCPVLLLSGDRDDHARIDLLRASARLLPDARLAVYPGIGHGLGRARDQALIEMAAFVHRLDSRP
jgi:predicted alpha/beta-hydrolase family hydrolase